MDQSRKKSLLWAILVVIVGFAGGLFLLAIVAIILSALGILNTWG